MKRTSFGKMHCPIARSLERVGEWWSMLILRDALAGMTRFDEFQNSLGIAPNMLTRRLTALVKAGLLKRHRYSAHPPRYEYLLTERGQDFRTVLIALMAYGNRHFAPEGQRVTIVNARTGEAAEPIFVDARSIPPMPEAEFKLVAGPAATQLTKKRLAKRRSVNL
jgi:DNA-binding HxlR family transcriptional regulator